MRLAIFFTVAALAARAQNGSQLNDWHPDREPQRKPKLACSELRRETGYEFTVATAELIPAAGAVPEHCRVQGQIAPEIRFEVNLPSAWNERMYMFGNGGFAGE